MREIEFRGKRIDNGEWIYGDLTRYSEEMSYITEDLIENKTYQVSTETVGQYTGLKDRNNVKIYEKDIVHTNKGKMIIEYLKDSFQCIDNSGCNYRLFDFIYNGCIKVIGTIYDNKELIKEEAQTMKLFNVICRDDDYDIQEVQTIVAINDMEASKKAYLTNQFYSNIKIKELDIIDGYKIKLERIEE